MHHLLKHYGGDNVANKRMFSNTVIDSDMFLDLSPMAQLLYFHCGMKTDDDGFVSGAKRISKIIGATDKDFQSLIDSGFLIEFPDSKVFVIVHHRQNNDLKNDRYHQTNYRQEFEQLELTANREYRRKQIVSNVDTDCIHDVSNVDTEQNVTKPIVTQKNVTHDSGGKGSDEGKTVMLTFCQSKGLDPRKIAPLIDQYGKEKIHDAVYRWINSKQGTDKFTSFIETEE